MISRTLNIATILFVLIPGCTPTREIVYSVKGIEPVTTPSTAITRAIRLSIEPFEDIRETIPDNGILFTRERETILYEKDYCINAEEHYRKGKVPTQIAEVMTAHLKRRATFKSVGVNASKDKTDYVLTGKLRRLYGEQEVSTAAKVGAAFFGLIGALATSGAATNGSINIEFVDLVLHRITDGTEKRIENVTEAFAGELDADGNCWCAYDNINRHLRFAVDTLAVRVEGAVSELEMPKP